MSKEKYFCSESITNISKEMIANIPYVREFSFDIESAALLVIDMQSCFFDERYDQVYVPSFDAIMPNINDMIRFFDLKNRPVIYTKHMDDSNSANNMMAVWWEKKIGGGTSDIHEGINRSKNGLIVEKTQYDAFFRTNLEELLNKNNVSSVVTTGIIADLCVETTARSAFMHGYRVFLPADAVAAQNRKFHEASLLNLSHGFTYLCLTKDIVKNQSS